MTAVHRRPALVVAGLALILPLGLGACSTEKSLALAPSTIVQTLPAEESTTSAPTTTIATTTTTVAPTTTAAPTTTVAPTTTAPLPEMLPQPVAPPPPRADEAYIELGTIEIPKLQVARPLLEGITLTTLDRGPGHWPGTAMPGEWGNVVVAGHRTSHDKPFRYIDQLAPGDEVIFTTDAGRHVYRVTGTSIVKPDAIYIIDQTPAKTATLFACHPVGSTRERIVVHLSLDETA